MPMKEGYHYAPAPNDRQPAKQAPHASATRQQPAKSNPGTGRLGGMFPKVSGGAMQGGGKRRASHKP